MRDGGSEKKSFQTDGSPAARGKENYASFSSGLPQLQSRTTPAPGLPGLRLLPWPSSPDGRFRLISMRIAVDAMGGDYAPSEIVAGAVLAAADFDGITRLYLVGDETAVRKELARHAKVPGCIELYHASEAIGMDEHPATAVRRKKDSSINRALDLVKSGEADAMLSAGNTGAVMAASTLKLRTLEGIDRPAIATVLPSPYNPFILIDAGANTDCSPLQLLQFAIMGVVYARQILGRETPVVGLMSVGTEATKGNETTKEAFRLLEASGLNFKGNIEGHDLFAGRVDVVVCDGFVGNVILKTAESVGHAVGKWIKQEFTANPLRMLGALLLRGATNSMKRVMDPATYGGAPLLGINGISIVTHGSSKANAIYHAVRVARESVQSRLNQTLVREIKNMGGVP